MPGMYTFYHGEIDLGAALIEHVNVETQRADALGNRP